MNFRTDAPFKGALASAPAMSTLGLAFGACLAPAFFVVARTRGGRSVHRDGVLCEATATALAHEDPRLGALARLFEGPALARFSAAFWREERRRGELLGLALRIGAQDLLLTTLRRPWSFPMALLRTRADDYLGNDYFSIAFFDFPGLEPLEFRAISTGPGAGTTAGACPGEREKAGAPAPDRVARLREAVALDDARLRLQVRPRRAREWTDLAELRVGRVLETGLSPRLRFSPFRAGGKLRPLGFVNGLRRLAYSASWRADARTATDEATTAPPRLANRRLRSV